MNYLAEGVAYARCYFAAMVAALLLNMGTALLRAVGDTRGPAVIIASGCLVNAVLDVIFVAVLHMEALGCGIAVALTICSNATMIVIAYDARTGCVAAFTVQTRH